MAPSDAELLLAVFRFKHQRPSAVQSEAFCLRLRDALGACVDEILAPDGEISSTDKQLQESNAQCDPLRDDHDAAIDAFTALDIANLQRGWVQLYDEPEAVQVGAVWTLQWFPQYGGVLQAELVSVDTVALRVLALDKWEWARHFLPTGDCVDSAVPTNHVVLSCGRFAYSLLSSVQEKIAKSMGAAAQITGSERNAATAAIVGTAGHQKTPQFLVAMVRSVLDSVDVWAKKNRSPHMSRGGMTDVGLHTGGAARDTCWPLVSAALRQSLPKYTALFEKVRIAFYSRLLDCELLGMNGTKAFHEQTVGTFWHQIDVCFQLLEAIVDRVTDLDAADYDATGILTKCQLWRQQIDHNADFWGSASCIKYRLAVQDETAGSFEYPTLAVPDQKPFDSWNAITLNGIHGANSSRDIQHEFFHGPLDSPIPIMIYLESISPGEKVKTQFALRLIEKFLFQAASSLQQPLVRGSRKDHDPEPLLDMMLWYQDHMAEVGTSTDDLERVQRQSVYTVLCYVAFCLAHRHCCSVFPVIGEHKIALDWRRLEVCVLHESASRDAIVHVANYVRSCNAQATKAALFDLSNQAGTLALAGHLGQVLPVYQDLYLEVISRFRVMGESQWKQVEMRKSSLLVLRQDIKSCEAALAESKMHLAHQEDALKWEWSLRNPRARPPKHLSSWQTQLYSQEIYRLTDLLRQKTAFRDELSSLPEFLTSPLPANQEEALQLLLLLAPPPLLDLLAGLCWRAQRSLAPASAGVCDAPPSSTSWLQHVKTSIGGYPFEQPAQYLTVFPVELEIPSSFGPSTVDEVPSQEAFLGSCVWFPSGADSTLGWASDSGEPDQWVNPFLVEAAESKRFFTPHLSGGDAAPASSSTEWEWMVAYPGESGPERGNLSYAQQCMRWDDSERKQTLDAAQFTALSSLRAYPAQQLRRIFGSVATDSLAWADPSVAMVVKQALYQVGAIEVVRNGDAGSAYVAFAWHDDLVHGASVGHFYVVLAQLVDKIGLSPRRWDCLPLVGALAAFLQQYDPRARPLSLQLARMARRWAHESRDEWQSATLSDDERREMRCRECVLYGYAALCFATGSNAALEDDESTELCDLLVLFHHAKLFAGGDLLTEVASISSKIEWMMADRVVALVETLAVSPQLPVKLCRLVRTVLSGVSAGVAWHQVNTGQQDRVASRFVGIDTQSGTTYSVNLFSGEVTSNGGHPTGLPDAVRHLSRYRALFGERDFEVVNVLDVYQTTAAQNAHARAYRFCVVEGQLAVEEVGTEFVLQLCTEQWMEACAAALPARLAELYSHWYWLARRVVLLRGREATDTGVYYVVRFDVDGTARCYEVPRQDQLLPYAVLLKRLRLYVVLVLPDPAMYDVLEKFENPRFIHSLRQPNAPHILEICLPRFGLRFVRDARGRLASVNHRGFVLRERQQLEDQMPRFRQYLLLQSLESERQAVRIVVPMGCVQYHDTRGASSGSSGLVEIELPPDAAATITCSAFDQHPRLHCFAPETMETRVQLAAIYLASSNRTVWRALRMTGSDACLELLRGCVPSRPFSALAVDHLTAIASRFAFRSASVTLMVGALLEKSRRLAVLFDEAPAAQHRSIDITDALDAYRNLHCGDRALLQSPVRQLLSPAEECDLLGSAAAADLVHRRLLPQRSDRTAESTINHEEGYESLLDGSFLESCEHQLLLARSSKPVDDGSSALVPVPAFPLSPHGSNEMNVRMMSDLQASWHAHHHHCSAVHSISLLTGESLANAESLIRDAVRDRALWLWGRMECAVKRVRVADRLAQTVGRQAELTLADVMRSVVDHDALLRLAPHLSVKERARWIAKGLRYLELCVLEDKLARMRASKVESDVLEELQSITRRWDPAEHPYWLVLEVEARLQIRHEQFVVAQHLIDHPGSICQLNMGRGKTRVILPMLFLYFSHRLRATPKDARGQLVRAHFLSPLLSETRELMWSVLTSSVLALPFVELPYNRSCSLTLAGVQMIRHVLDEAKRTGAVVMVAPEHRLSLELERVELRTRGSDELAAQTLCVLEDVLDPAQFVDVFDESDALLHHGYHLVYAVGASKALDGGATRWLVAEALLRVLGSMTSTRVQGVLVQNPDLWSIQPEYRVRCGAGADGGGGVFNGFRLHLTTSSSSDAEHARAALRVALAEDLMDRPPFDLEWLLLLGGRRDARATLVRLLTDASVDADELLQQLPQAVAHVKNQVLALRGFLAFRVLETSLQKRYRVEYGHPPPGARRKQIAIPYQAADLPADRSEFSHPDVGIMLTLLSFYHSGLSNVQVRQAFQVLLTLDDSESARYYDEWYTSIGPQLEDAELCGVLADLDHVSVDNTHQFAILCRSYRFASEVVNFYVNFCVFPSDTRQFPHRLSRSAWDLVCGPTNLGFSGTNDTHYLLPRGVAQREPTEPALRGTNGRMVQLLLDATHGYEPLAGTEACWQSLLLQAVNKQCHALIDTGALLAGVSNHEAAQFLLRHPEFAFQGVTYYDTRPQFDAWAVLERDRNMVDHHKNASLRESDTFVIFDEARARGSDMKLLPIAVALLTLGPTMTKDKLMQGAGRMRLLAKNQQTLWLTSTRDVYQSIAYQAKQTTPGLRSADPAHSTQMLEVLNWVVNNTQHQCTLGLLEWAQSGIQHHSRQADPAHDLQDDDWTLDGQYSAAESFKLISEIIHARLANAPGAEVVSNVVSYIRTHGETFGSHDAVRVTTFDEECEREVEIEEEQQEASAAGRHHVVPCVERAWDWRALLDARSVDALVRKGIGIEMISLEQAALTWLRPLSCGQVAWARTNIFATANFWSTLQIAPDSSASDSPADTSDAYVWNSSLRHVHALVVFADGSVLLLTEYEEDAVLTMLRTATTDSTLEPLTTAKDTQRVDCQASLCLVHLPFVVDFLMRMEPSTAATVRLSMSDMPFAMSWRQGDVTESTVRGLALPFLSVVACCLLNGDTELFMGRHAVAAESALRVLLENVIHREATMQEFITLRGFTVRWKRSSLHAIAKRMDLHDALVPRPTAKLRK